MRAVFSFIGLVMALVMAAPGVAEARWLRAESERFILYSDGDERTLREYAIKLETFDRVLRTQFNLPVDAVPARKLPIYLVGRQSGIDRLRPGVDPRIAGLYMAQTDDIFAIAIRTRGEDHTLLHEYAHHFMMQNSTFNYPSWFIEGFAEYYMTAELQGNRVVLGKFTEGRTLWLTNGPDWLPLSELLTKSPSQVATKQETYYPLAWLVTHWFMSNPARKQALARYMTETARGQDPVQAMERATGMPLPQFERLLRGYVMGGNLQITGFTHTFARPEVTIAALPASADDMLLLNQRLKVGVRAEHEDETLAEVRRLAATHGADPLARRTLGRAEIELGDRAAGVAGLTALLEEHPDDVEALQLLAQAALDGLGEEGVDPLALRRTATEHLRKAYALDDANYLTLYLLAYARQGQAGYPNDNDVDIWEQALILAPQLDGIRLNAAAAFMAKGRRAQAIATLAPMLNDPHGGGGAAAARSLIERAMGRPAGTDPAAPANDDEPADDAEEDPATAVAGR